MTGILYKTSNPQAEIFLTSENAGFLMLSASGNVYRKWQGLQVGELSVFSEFDWSLNHSDSEHVTGGKIDRTWTQTSRTESSVTRYWTLSCGCRCEENWMWTEGSQTIDISWTPVSVPACRSTGVNYSLRVIPQWTLCPAGYASAGGGMAELLFHPREAQYLRISSKLMAADMRLFALAKSDRNQSDWIPLESPAHVDSHTAADAMRGENQTRSTVATHESKMSLTSGEKAGLTVVLQRANTASGEQGNRSVEQPAGSRHTEFVCHGQKEDWQIAFANSRDSLNQLIRRRADGIIGLQAGLPWFTQFWTRDMCHSFRAAFLWSGRFADGGELICDLWSKAKDTIPNYTTVNATTSNSADALPLLLLSTADYIDFCGISAHLRALFPNILTHLRNAALILKKGQFICHGPADTWMDAQKSSPDGKLLACSPRANRAIEIQAFWIAALERWSDILVRSSGGEDAEAFSTAARSGLKSLREQFYNPDKRRWADHLRPDGSQDLALRPNVLLAFSALSKAGILGLLLKNQELSETLEDMVNSDLIVSYGIRTLSPETPVRYPWPINEIYESESNFIFENKIHFHPFHEFGSRKGLEHPDWAYHNGTIWPWLSRCATNLLLMTSHSAKALQLTKTLVWHSVYGAGGGALPELLDGLSSHSDWSWPKGAPHQAWSEAALIDMVIEDWLGISVSDFSGTLNINAQRWKYLGDFSLTFSLVQAQIRILKSDGEITVELLDHIQPQSDFDLKLSGGITGESLHVKNVLSGQLPLKLNLSFK